MVATLIMRIGALWHCRLPFSAAIATSRIAVPVPSPSLPLGLGRKGALVVH